MWNCHYCLRHLIHCIHCIVMKNQNHDIFNRTRKNTTNISKWLHSEQTLSKNADSIPQDNFCLRETMTSILQITAKLNQCNFLKTHSINSSRFINRQYTRRVPIFEAKRSIRQWKEQFFKICSNFFMNIMHWSDCSRMRWIACTWWLQSKKIIHLTQQIS